MKRIIIQFVLLLSMFTYSISLNAQANYKLKDKTIWRNDSALCELKLEFNKQNKPFTNILNNIGRTMMVVTPMPSAKKCERMEVVFLFNGKSASFPFIGFADKKAIAAMIMNNGLICPKGYDFDKIKTFLTNYPKQNATDTVSVSTPKK